MSSHVIIKNSAVIDGALATNREQDQLDALEQGFKGVINFEQVRVEDIITLTARLAQVLAAEADFLEKMQVGKIADLQKEKIMLTNALALIKKQLPQDESFLSTLEAEQVQSLKEVITVFNVILEENYTRLNTARMVNQRVVEAVTEVVREHTQQDAYDDKGKMNSAASESMPISLNKKI